MKSKNLIAITLTTAIASAIYAGAAQAASEAHTHIGHVISGWKDTPEGKGFLPTALAEAKVAADHAGYGAAALDDLAAMKLHAGHVRHAIDPSSETKGPGLGYGLVKASNGAIKHITLASKSGGASDNVKKHTTHVVSSSGNAVERAKLAVSEADAIIAATSAADAAPHATKLAAITQHILQGHDTNGDGKISWHKDEGGLDTADKHMGFMLDGEGLKR